MLANLLARESLAFYGLLAIEVRLEPCDLDTGHTLIACASENLYDVLSLSVHSHVMLVPIAGLKKHLAAVFSHTNGIFVLYDEYFWIGM